MKKILAIVMSLLLCGILVACSDEGESGSSTGEDTSESEVQESETAASEDGGVINLYTWEGMFPQEVLDGFTDETGIKINYVNFDLNENMLAKLETENGGTYDVIIADDYIIETAIEEELVGKLDKDLLSNFDNINSLYQGQFFDPNDEYTVPYGAGVQTIVYNPNLTDVEIKNYADLFDPALSDNIGLIANYRVVNGIGLKVLGESYNTEDLDVIEEAGELMLDLAPNIRLIKDDNLQDDLITGEIAAAVMYTSQVTMAMMADPDLEVVYPEEGIGFGIMGSFIPVNAPNPEGAHAFLDYILRPEISVQCFEYLGYYCTNEAADSLISDEFQEFLTLPEGLIAEDMEMIGNVNTDALDTHEKVWTSFKTACGQ